MGKLIDDRRQGLALTITMAILWLGAAITAAIAEFQSTCVAATAAGAALEGKDLRFGIGGSALFTVTSTATSTGAVNSSLDSASPFGGGVALVNMMLGEVGPGGVGSGLTGMLLFALVAVFIAGLMVGRTPEYCGKKITSRQIKYVALYLLTTPAIVLLGTAITLAIPSQAARAQATGPHGLTEILYAFTSAANNNGSAFAGLSADSTYFNIALSLAMLLGRFLPILLVLGLASSLADEDHVPVTAGTLQTHRPMFVLITLVVVVTVGALTYFPALALGPLAEGLS
jgi:K+-transporting ATPase ATPase A chain